MSDEIKEYWLSEEFQSRYEIAMEEINNYLVELGSRYENEHGVRCIRFIEKRLKSVESIEAKLERKELEKNPKVMEKKINDIAGVRLICFDTDQVYRLAWMISADNRYEIVKAKDYINKPKANGYQSYHIVLNVPVHYHSKDCIVKVEIQLRTILMDAWASVDATVRYKKKKETPVEIDKLIQQFTKRLKKEDKIIQIIMETE